LAFDTGSDAFVVVDAVAAAEQDELAGTSAANSDAAKGAWPGDA
jgi:hypothetical protein